MVKPTPKAAVDAWMTFGAAEEALVSDAIEQLLVAAKSGRLLDTTPFIAVLATAAFVAAMTKRLQHPVLGVAYGAGELQYIQRGCNLVSTWEATVLLKKAIGIENWRRSGSKDGVQGWGLLPYAPSTIIEQLRASGAVPRFGFELRRNLSQLEAVQIRGKDWSAAYHPQWLAQKPPTREGEVPLRRGFLRWYGTFVGIGWASALNDEIKDFEALMQKFQSLWFMQSTAGAAPAKGETATWLPASGFDSAGTPLAKTWPFDPNVTGVATAQTWFMFSQQIAAASTLGINWPLSAGSKFRTAAALNDALRTNLPKLVSEAAMWQGKVDLTTETAHFSRPIADESALLPWMDLCYFRNPWIGGFVVEVSPIIPVAAAAKCYTYSQQLVAWARMIGWCLALWYRRLESFPSSPLLAAQKAQFRPKTVLRFASEMNLGQEQPYGLRYDGKSPSPQEYQAAFKALRAAVIAGFDKALQLEGLETKAIAGTNWPHKAANVLEFAAVLNMTTHRPDVSSDANNWKVLGHDGDTTIQDVIGPLLKDGLLGSVGADLYGMMRNKASQAQEATSPIMHTPQAATLPIVALGKAAVGLPLVVAEMGFQTLGSLVWAAIKDKATLASPGGAETSTIEGSKETLTKACYSGRWWLRAAYALLRAAQLDLAQSGAALDASGGKIAAAAPELRLLYFDVNKLLAGEGRDFSVTESWQSVQSSATLAFVRESAGWASLAATQDAVSWVQAESDWQDFLTWVRASQKPAAGATWRSLVVAYFQALATKEGL